METLNAELRNKVQPLHTIIEMMDIYNNPSTSTTQKEVIMEFVFNKEHIKLLKELESFLIN